MRVGGRENEVWRSHRSQVGAPHCSAIIIIVGVDIMMMIIIVIVVTIIIILEQTAHSVQPCWCSVREESRSQL